LESCFQELQKSIPHIPIRTNIIIFSTTTRNEKFKNCLQNSLGTAGALGNNVTAIQQAMYASETQ